MGRVIKRKRPRRLKAEGRKLQAAVVLGRRGGIKGGPARAKALTPLERTRIARKGGKARMRLLHKARPG